MEKTEKRGNAGRHASRQKGIEIRRRIGAALESFGKKGATARELAKAVGLELVALRWHLRESPETAAIAKTRDVHLVRYWSPLHKSLAARYEKNHNSQKPAAFYLSEEKAQAFIKACEGGKSVTDIGLEIGIASSTASLAASLLIKQGRIQSAIRPGSVIGRKSGGVVRICWPLGVEIPVYEKPSPKKRVKKPKEPKQVKVRPVKEVRRYAPIVIPKKDTRPVDASRAKVTVIPNPLPRFSGTPEPMFSAMRPGTYLPAETWTSRVYG